MLAKRTCFANKQTFEHEYALKERVPQPQCEVFIVNKARIWLGHVRALFTILEQINFEML